MEIKVVIPPVIVSVTISVAEMKEINEMATDAADKAWKNIQETVKHAIDEAKKGKGDG